MRGDIPQAAFRLLNTLPVRTHERPEWRKPIGSGNNAKGSTGIRVEHQGKLYRSIAAACKALHVGDAKLKTMIRNGEAKIVK